MTPAKFEGFGVGIPYLILFFASFFCSLILALYLGESQCVTGRTGAFILVFLFTLVFAVISFFIQCLVVHRHMFESRQAALYYGLRTASMIFIAYLLIICLFLLFLLSRKI